ncbi:hypothetical protein HDV00_008828 [Rhizophlyctis rosea]|nr:hypothetical protein HDV00_008828 [Rhizophlyctis rosea]
MTTLFDRVALDLAYFSVWEEDLEGASALIEALFVEFESLPMLREGFFNSRITVYQRRAENLRRLKKEADLLDDIRRTVRKEIVAARGHVLAAQVPRKCPAREKAPLDNHTPLLQPAEKDLAATTSVHTNASASTSPKGSASNIASKAVATHAPIPPAAPSVPINRNPVPTPLSSTAPPKPVYAI